MRGNCHDIPLNLYVIYYRIEKVTANRRLQAKYFLSCIFARINHNTLNMEEINTDIFSKPNLKKGNIQMNETEAIDMTTDFADENQERVEIDQEEEEQIDRNELALEIDTSFNYTYDLHTFAFDPTVETLVSYMSDQRKKIIIPSFQRGYVWSRAKASLFIHSLLIGFPVPSIFMALEKETQKYILIDGQQRLRSLYRFIHLKKWGNQTFRLKLPGSEQYDNKSYYELSFIDQEKLIDRHLHAIVVQQKSPANSESDSLYHIYQRLNTGGALLHPQEIRSAIFYGPFNNWLNQYVESTPEHWRFFFPRELKNMRAQERILRFLAAYYYGESYDEPMLRFLNRAMESNRDSRKHPVEEMEQLLNSTLSLTAQYLGKDAFVLERNNGKILQFNVALFEALMVGMAKLVAKGLTNLQDTTAIQSRYELLIQDPDFKKACKESTADKRAYNTRHKMVFEQLIKPILNADRSLA
jgi:hypothetical protein